MILLNENGEKKILPGENEIISSDWGRFLDGGGGGAAEGVAEENDRRRENNYASHNLNIIYEKKSNLRTDDLSECVFRIV